MPRINRLRLSLADVMILVATTGVSLAICIGIDNGLFQGQRYFFGIFAESQGKPSALELINRTGGALSIFLMIFGGWTLALPVLVLWKGRPQWWRRSRQPGISACIAATIGMLFWSAIGCGALWLRSMLEQRPLSPNFWVQSPVFDGVIVCSGASVAAVWVNQIITGRWRPVAHAFDRLGRGLGLLWLAAGATFAARLLLS